MTSRPWSVVLLPLLAIGCATTFAGSSQDPVAETAAAATGDDLAQIKERVLELQRQAVMADVEIERLRRQVVALESRLAGGTAVEERLSAPVAEPEPWSPPPAVEESDLETEPVAVAESIAAYESGVEEAPIAAPPVAPQNDPEHEPITAAAQALYDRGYTLYHQGRYVDAEASFQQFLQGHGGTELTDNAQYWVGECRFARGDFRGALAAFQMTVDRFPEGNKVSDAILKMGDAHQALQETEHARERWEEVRRRFPGSAAATVAEDRLAG